MAHFLFLINIVYLFALEGFDGFFDGGDAGFGIGFLLLLESHDLRFGVLYEALVAQFCHNAAEEALLVLQVGFEFLELFLYVDERVHRNGELGRADDKLGVTAIGYC